MSTAAFGSTSSIRAAIPAISSVPVTWYTPATESRKMNVPSRLTVVKTSAAPSSRLPPP